MMKARPIRIDEDVAYISLTKGYEAMIDVEDLELVGAYNWYAHVHKRIVYARRTSYIGRKATRVYMHRAIMGSQGVMVIDHIDCNGLNNRRCNLRFATQSQNLQNQRTRLVNKSGIKGVSWDRNTSKWRAQISAQGKKISIGYFESKELAQSAYSEASKSMHKDYSRVS